NVPDQFSIGLNFTQSIIDPADGLNEAQLILAPADGSPRNVLQVEDFGDQVVANPANEALAVATGLQLVDPFVQNLHQNPSTLPIVPTVGTIHGNATGGATAALLQNGPATHASSIGTSPGTVTFVPEFAHPEEYALNGGFPTLERGIRVPNAGILDEGSPGSPTSWRTAHPAGSPSAARPTTTRSRMPPCQRGRRRTRSSRVPSMPAAPRRTP